MAFSSKLRILLLNVLGYPELVDELENNVGLVTESEIEDGSDLLMALIPVENEPLVAHILVDEIASLDSKFAGDTPI